MLAELAAAFSTPEAFVQLVMLTFLEIILGVDNIVFISITSDRIKKSQQHIGRKLGLAAAMVTRIALLFTLGWVMHLTKPLCTIPLGFMDLEVTGKGIILLVGGAYLIYKGIAEIKEMLSLTAEREEFGHPDHTPKPPLSLGRAVATIAVMDISLFPRLRHHRRGHRRPCRYRGHRDHHRHHLHDGLYRPGLQLYQQQP